MLFGDIDEDEFDEDFDEEEEYDVHDAYERSQDLIMNMWMSIHMESKNELDFTTFRESLAESLEHAALDSAPFMRGIVGQRISTVQRQPTIQMLHDLISNSTGKPSVERKYDTNQVKNVIKSSQQKKEEQGTNWNVECDYNINEEDVDEDFENMPSEWKNFGVDIKRLQIGNWSPVRNYHGQQRLKVNVIDKTLIYNMYHFVVKTQLGFPESDNAMVKAITKQYVNFKLSRNLMMEIPFDHIVSLGLHVQQTNRFETNEDEDYDDDEEELLALLVIDINDAPNFYNRRILSDVSDRNQFRRRTDFTPNKVASTCSRHYVLADAHQLKQTIGIMLEVDPSLSNRFDVIPIDQEPIQLEIHSVNIPKSEKEKLIAGGTVGVDDDDDEDNTITTCTIEEVTDEDDDDDDEKQQVDSDTDELD
jgi:hypothetical protein